MGWHANIHWGCRVRNQAQRSVSAVGTCLIDETVSRCSPRSLMIVSWGASSPQRTLQHGPYLRVGRFPPLPRQLLAIHCRAVDNHARRSGSRRGELERKWCSCVEVLELEFALCVLFVQPRSESVAVPQPRHVRWWDERLVRVPRSVQLTRTRGDGSCISERSSTGPHAQAMMTITCGVT